MKTGLSAVLGCLLLVPACSGRDADVGNGVDGVGTGGNGTMGTGVSSGSGGAAGAGGAGGAQAPGLVAGKECVPNGAGQPCAAGLTCVKQSSGSYAICDILLQPPPGACCQQNVDCAPFRICDSGVCIPNRSGRCSPTAPFGGVQCWQDHTCEPDNSVTGGHCVGAASPKALGELCHGQDECGMDAFCNGHCTMLSGEGGPCIAEPNGLGCKAGYGCSADNLCHGGAQCGPM